MNTPLTLRQRIRYFVDELMGRGSIGTIGLLTLLTGGLIIVVAGIMTLIGAAPSDGEPVPFAEALWLSMVRTLDAGTFGADQGWRFRVLMFVDTLGGLLIVALLIGVLSNAIEERLRELRKGRSLVAESGHTLILGWSPKVFTVVNQLVLANESQRNPLVVVLADRDKVQMEDELRSHVPNRRNMHVICRRGSPIDRIDLEIGRPHAAKSIIVLASDEGEPDAEVIKTILAITNRKREVGGPRLNIVAEIREPQNLHVAQIVGRDDAAFVLTSDLIARIIAQTCRTCGLATIYLHLLDYGGSEVYFTTQPALTGMTFGDAQFAYDTSVVIGIRRGDGEVLVNPRGDAVFEANDQAIVIAIDDSQIPLDGIANAQVDEAAIRSGRPAKAGAEHTLILGWNPRGVGVILELDDYVGRGSTVRVVAEAGPTPGELAFMLPNLNNIEVRVERGNTGERSVLETLQIKTCDHVILLCDRTVDAQKADARVLMTLLHLRDMVERDGQPFSLTSEILDIGNRGLAEVLRVDDFIVSDQLPSLMMAQFAENREVGLVYGEFFSAEGNEVYIRPATDYVAANTPLDFYTITESARRKGEVAIGYRVVANKNDVRKEYGIVINPGKREKITLTDADKVIVIARG